MKKLFLIISLISLSLALHAQENTGDLKTLINQSFSYFPQFKELGQAIDVEQQRITLAKSAGLPSVQATGSYRYTSPVSQISIPAGGNVLDFSIMPKNNYNTSLDGSYMLWDFGVVKAGVDRAKAGLEYAKDNLEFNRNQVAFQVGNIYYQITYLKNAISIQDSVINFLEVNKKDTEIKFKNGDALKYDVLSIQSSIDQEGNRKIELQNNLNKQYALMEYATGTSIKANSSDFVFPAANNYDLNEALAEAQNNHPEFRLIKDRIQQAEAELKVSQTNGKPSLIMSGGTGYKNGFTPDLDKFRYNYSAGVTLNIPIYQGGRARKQVRLSQSQLLQTKYSEESLSNTYRKDIQQAMIDITSNTSSLINSARQVTEAKEAQKLAHSRYRNGIGTNLELTNASTNVQKAELTNLQYKYQLCVAQLTIAKLTGFKYW
ncbi:TolC family protein [Pedobacter cryoconitis]|uniref:Outer membrane protein TolC n=1 Tax=Pedobacter cryoconitis TaxID=188932 RepID=A0A327SI43_9SPHI|nr:TolC family protein [Pedobacter cryoconitis]RAJ27283.1 outer membrane protein TolC [Pedobacter cryoconitis]